MSLLSEIQTELLRAVVQGTPPPDQNITDSDPVIGEVDLPVHLVRRHDKNLGKLGDLSFPSPDNNKVWKKSMGAKEPNLTDIKSALVNNKYVSNVMTSSKSWVVHLDRAQVMKTHFEDSSNSNAGFLSKTTVICDKDKAEKQINKVINVDKESSDLTAIRTAFFSEILENCLREVSVESPTVFMVGSKAIPVEDFALPGHETKIVKVGPVLGSGGKKVDQDIQAYRQAVYDKIGALDGERCDDDDEPAEARDRRLNCLTSAEVKLSLVASSPASQTTINAPGYSAATFVLYNSARLSQILASFDESVRQGVYPSLPGGNVQWHLLQEEEEWEIFYIYLLPYTDVLSEAVHQLKLHKIALHLTGLSGSLSRYYSRVKILRDPLPNLIPLIHARVRFIQEVQNVILSSLNILGLQQLKKM